MGQPLFYGFNEIKNAKMHHLIFHYKSDIGNVSRITLNPYQSMDDKNRRLVCKVLTGDLGTSHQAG
jgi:hypothetical protein